MARRLARAQSSQKYRRRPFSTEQVQVTGRLSAVVPQRAQEKRSSGVRESFTLVTIALRAAPVRATHRGHNTPRGPVRSDRPPRERHGDAQCMTAMASARRARSETRSARRCMRRAAIRRAA